MEDDDDDGGALWGVPEGDDDRGEAKVTVVIAGLRSQGSSLRQVTEAHRRAVARCTRFSNRWEGVERADALSDLVCRGSRAIVRRAVGHVAVCATVSRTAMREHDDELTLGSARFAALRAEVLTAVAEDEIRRTVRSVMCWFAEVVCRRPLSRVREQLWRSAAELRLTDATLEEQTASLRLDDAPVDVAREAREQRRLEYEAAVRDAYEVAARWSRRLGLLWRSRTALAELEAAIDSSASSSSSKRGRRRRKLLPEVRGDESEDDDASSSFARLELALALSRAAGDGSWPRARSLEWLCDVAAPRPFESPGIAEDALDLIVRHVAADGDAASVCGLSRVCRRFRDAARRGGASALAASVEGVSLYVAHAQDDDDDARDASLAATLRWVATAKPRALRVVGSRSRRKKRDRLLKAAADWASRRSTSEEHDMMALLSTDDEDEDNQEDLLTDLHEAAAHSSLAAVFSIGAPRLRGLLSIEIVDLTSFDDGSAAALAAGCEALTRVLLRGTSVGDGGLAALAAGLRATLTHVELSSCSRSNKTIKHGSINHHHHHAPRRRRRTASWLDDDSPIRSRTRRAFLGGLREASATAAASQQRQCRVALGDVGVAALSRVCAPSLRPTAADSTTTAILNVPIRATRTGRLCTLRLERHARLSDEGVLAAASGLGGSLLHLSFEGCALLSDLAPVAVADACPYLRSLSLEACPKVTDVGALALARHSQLRHLHLRGTRCTAVGVSAVLEHCTRLACLWPRADSDRRRDHYYRARKHLNKLDNAPLDDYEEPFAESAASSCSLAELSVLRDICVRRGAFESFGFDRTALASFKCPGDLMDPKVLEDIVHEAKKQSPRRHRGLNYSLLAPRWGSNSVKGAGGQLTLVLDADHVPLFESPREEEEEEEAVPVGMTTTGLLRPGCELVMVDGRSIGDGDLKAAREVAVRAQAADATLSFATLSVLQMAFAMLLDSLEGDSDPAEVQTALGDAGFVRFLLERLQQPPSRGLTDSVLPWAYADRSLLASTLSRSIRAFSLTPPRRTLLEKIRFSANYSPLRSPKE